MIFKLFAILILAAPAANERSTSHAERIDAILQERFASENISPLPICDDLTFLRRASLDLRGRIPSEQEVHEFESDPDRAAAIDSMLDSEEFNRFLSESWTAWLLGYSNAFKTDREMFRIWLEREIGSGTSFKQLAHRMIVANGSVATNGPANFLARHRYDPAVTVSRSFLGVRLECAQCHDHPFDRWTQDDFLRMNRFFSTMRLNERNGTVFLSDENGNDQGENRPRFLTGSVPTTNRYREELALYVTNCKPFARTFANRAWYHLMGRGIVDPPDDHNQENPPSDSNLFQAVTEIAVAEDFKIKPLFRAICLSQAYQRESASRIDRKSIQLFAARQIKPLLPEQYVDSLLIATGQTPSPRQRREMIQRVIGRQNLDEDFQRTWDYRETVQQLMEKISVDIGRQTTAATRQRTTGELYLQILTRRPTEREKEICRDRSKSDVAFALLFGNEFFFNH